MAGDSMTRGWLGAALGVVIVALLLPLAVFLVASWLLGWQLQSVQSGSMGPTYPVGSLLVVGQIDSADVEPGMAIVFQDPRDPARLVTHRVVRRVPGETVAFVTQGDANATADPTPVPARLVRGRVLWSVSALGGVMDWLQWPRSFILLVLVPGTLLVILEVRARRPRREVQPGGEPAAQPEPAPPA
jgi:signal peptidase I